MSYKAATETEESDQLFHLLYHATREEMTQFMKSFEFSKDSSDATLVNALKRLENLKKEDYDQYMKKAQVGLEEFLSHERFRTQFEGSVDLVIPAKFEGKHIEVPLRFNSDKPGTVFLRDLKVSFQNWTDMTLIVEFVTKKKQLAYSHTIQAMNKKKRHTAFVAGSSAEIQEGTGIFYMTPREVVNDKVIEEPDPELREKLEKIQESENYPDSERALFESIVIHNMGADRKAVVQVNENSYYIEFLRRPDIKEMLDEMFGVGDSLLTITVDITMGKNNTAKYYVIPKYIVWILNQFFQSMRNDNIRRIDLTEEHMLRISNMGKGYVKNGPDAKRVMIRFTGSGLTEHIHSEAAMNKVAGLYEDSSSEDEEEDS